MREARPVVGAGAVAIATAIGIAAGRAAADAAPAWLWAAAAIAAALAAARAVAPSAVVRALAVTALAGAALGAWAGAAPEVRGAAPPGVDDRGEDVVTGALVGPIVAGAGGDHVVIVDDAGRGRVGAWVPAGALAPGDRVRATGRLVRPRGLRNPGGVDRAQAAADRGEALELAAARVERVGGGWSWWAWPVAAQRWGSAVVAARGGPAAARAIVRGAVLGDRSAIDPATDAAWRAAGVYHVLSVSGLHLAVVALLAFALARRGLALLVPSRAAQRAAAAIAAALAIAYTAMTGGEVATVRALVVVLVALGGAWTGRRARLGDALGAAALAILVARPSAIADPSFQLSFAAAATLAALGGAGAGAAAAAGAARGGLMRRVARRALGWLGRGVAISAAVTATTAPITAAHFHQVALGGVVGNLVITPLVELVAIPAALIGVALAAVWAAAGGALIDVAVWACALADAAARAIAAAMPSSPAPPMGAVAAAAWLGAIGLLVAAARGAVRPGRAAAGALALTALFALAQGGRGPGARLRVTFVDVGQGDAAIVETPGGEVWLVDAGGEPGREPTAPGGPGEAIARVLAARRIDRVDVAIVSHPHPDHYLGLAALAARVPIGELWSADEPPRDRADDDPAARAGARAAVGSGGAAMPSFGDVAAALAARGTRIVHPPLGVARRSGGAVLRVLAPVFDPGDGARPIATADPVRSVNDDSLVVAVEVAGRRVLFAGDLEAEGEEALIAGAGPAIRADVVKVPHHGSPTSSTAALVGATGARWAVISCGVANRFGFPSPAVVARWQAIGAQVLRTDQRGAVTVTIDASGGAGGGGAGGDAGGDGAGGDAGGDAPVGAAHVAAGAPARAPASAPAGAIEVSTWDP